MNNEHGLPPRYFSSKRSVWGGERLPAAQGAFVEYFFDGVVALYVELEGNVIFQLSTADCANALFGILGQGAPWGVNFLFVLFSLGEILECFWALVTLVPEKKPITLMCIWSF